ncbi:MAG: zinc dependent phospholipase C family protein [Bernardetiaceae bacterium]|jgi:hypothetical protein|nr:zinc dependent phospholipase C family protein [Bernardetiaceae bacterium]
MTRKLAVWLLLCLAGGFNARAWGVIGHRVVHQMAIYGLPEPLRQFYFGERTYLLQHADRADLRRADDPDEAVRHYINIDHFGPRAAWQMPMYWTQARQKYPADTLLKHGILPWYTEQMRQRLTQAFRRRDVDSILFYSADLGHYLADAHVPFHVIQNYDGQLTGQEGIHGLWESDLPSRFLADYQLYQGNARYLAKPQVAVWEAVRRSFKLAQTALAAEHQVAAQFTQATKFEAAYPGRLMRPRHSPAFMDQYQTALGDMVAQQMRAAAQMVASYWFTCWVDAGRPSLPRPAVAPQGPVAPDQLAQELAAWRANQLHAQGWLLSQPPVKE